MNRNSMRKPITKYNYQVFADAPFLLCPRYHGQKFYPSFTGFTSLIDDIYHHLSLSDRHLDRIIPVEALRYYGSCLFWLRAIRLKRLFGVQLTYEENDLYCCTIPELTIPEPLFLGLQAIGRITTKTGVVFEPTFPPLATKCTNGIPGSYGVVDEENHHWYEDYPVIGPAYEALVKLREKASNKNPVESQYASVFAPSDLEVNFNLQGYRRLSTMRLCDLMYSLQTLGISKDGRDNTGFCQSTIMVVSDYLKRVNAFRNFCFSDLTSEGNIAQLIEAHPYLEDYRPNKNVAPANGEMIMHCYSKESQVEVGISAVYGLNLWKENLKCSEPWEQVRPWSCVQFTESNQPSEKWVSERNKYRNIPACFQAENFYSISFNAEISRSKVVNKLRL